MAIRLLILAMAAAFLACSPLPALKPPNENTPQSQIEERPEIRPDLDTPIDPTNPPPWVDEVLSQLPEPPEPDPLTVSTTTNGDYTVNDIIDETGGSLELEGAHGEHYSLNIPAGALLSEAEITMTQIASVDDVAADGEQLAAVQLEPDSLVLLQPATLTIELATTDDLDGYLSFAGGGSGSNVHAATGIESDGKLQIPLRHFSVHGTVSAKHGPNVNLLHAAIANSTPNGTATYNEGLVAKAFNEWLSKPVSADSSKEMFNAIYLAKLDWFWRPNDGVFWLLVDAQLDPIKVQDAIGEYLRWFGIGALEMPVFYNGAADEPVDFPFSAEVEIANELITKALKAGLDRPCRKPIEALYKIRFLHLGQALQADSKNLIEPFSGQVEPEFTEQYALEKVQECARFKVELESVLNVEGGEHPFHESAIVKYLKLVYGEPYEYKELDVQHSPDFENSSTGCRIVVKNGLITIKDIVWPLNFYDDAEFEAYPLTVELRIFDGPNMGCEGDDRIDIPLNWRVGRVVCPLKFEIPVSDFANVKVGQPLGDVYTCPYVQGDYVDSKYVEELLLWQDAGLFD